MEVDRGRLPAWPQKGVAVLAEHSSISTTDILTGQLFRPALLQAHTRRMEVDRGRLPAWPQKGVAVLAEHSSIFYDLVTPALMDVLFGQPA